MPDCQRLLILASLKLELYSAGNGKSLKVFEQEKDIIQVDFNKIISSAVSRTESSHATLEAGGLLRDFSS